MHYYYCWYMINKYHMLYRFPKFGIIHITFCPPSTAYMGQWIGSALAQITACRLLGDKPLSEPILEYSHISIKFQLNHQGNLYIFIQQNAFENVVCEMGAILSRGRWVNVWIIKMLYGHQVFMRLYFQCSYMRSMNINAPILMSNRISRKLLIYIVCTQGKCDTFLAIIMPNYCLSCTYLHE